MRFAWFAFGVTFTAFGIRLLLGGETGVGVVQVALGVGWLLIAVFKGQRRRVV